MGWWSDRWLSRAIDAHVQGINDPLAPWNRDDMPPECENCSDEEYEHCGFAKSGKDDEVCDKLRQRLEEDYRIQKEQDDAMYLCWLLEISEEEAKKAEVHEDWLKARERDPDA